MRSPPFRQKGFSEFRTNYGAYIMSFGLVLALVTILYPWRTGNDGIPIAGFDLLNCVRVLTLACLIVAVIDAVIELNAEIKSGSKVMIRFWRVTLGLELVFGWLTLTQLLS